MKKITYRKKDRKNSHSQKNVRTCWFHLNSKINDKSRNHFKYPNQKKHVFLFRLCIVSKSVIRNML